MQSQANSRKSGAKPGGGVDGRAELLRAGAGSGRARRKAIWLRSSPWKRVAMLYRVWMTGKLANGAPASEMPTMVTA